MTRVIVRMAPAIQPKTRTADIFISLEDPPWAIPNYEQLRPFRMRDE